MSDALAFDLSPDRPGRHVLGGVPDGLDARVLADLAARRAGRGGVLHVALDDTRLARLAEMLRFFAPDLTILELPAWDCLPYDRVSPHGDIVGKRVETLSLLAAGAPTEAESAPRLVLTTVNALTQRLPPRGLFENALFRARPGERVDLEALQAFLVRNGYSRAHTVREPGEFAFRGGIVDLFPPGWEEAVRLDLFGDELETLRLFDPISQRTTSQAEELVLRPMSEAPLDEAAIARFRAGYRETFGTVLAEDPLYEAITAGRRYPGMEHWLPLFHDGMATLFDYLPEAVLTLDHQADAAFATRLEQIGDFYQARRILMESGAKRGDGAPYKPLPTDRLYLSAEELAERLAERAVAGFSPFAGAAEGAGQGVDLGGRKGRDFADIRSNPDLNLYAEVRKHLQEQQALGRRVLLTASGTGARERLAGLLRDQGLAKLEPVEDWAALGKLPARAIGAAILPLENGFSLADLAVVTEQDILGDRLVRPQRKRKRKDAFLTEVSALTPGDLVVHADYGIGRYDGLETRTAGGVPHDCLRLLYAGNEKLFVPVENIEVLSRFGSEDTAVSLDRLGGGNWQARKARVKKKLKDMADELMRVAAARLLRKTDVPEPPEGSYEEFAARFPYPETDDQLRAIEEVLDDLRGGRPMDRLVCGDVGFGKTEVALRAAFFTAMGGGQVAVVVPTTLLARQHYQNFVARFRGLPVRIGQLSRLVSAKDANAMKAEMAEGGLDIVIGTHALLGKGVAFKNLSLVIVDEEQHFGVRQKEKLKQLRENVHVLTLTATPIPRTLQLSLAGVRELSLIATPPVDRLAVRTFVLPFDPMVVREAILREHFRGGQTYYVCPRIEDLVEVEERLKELVPEIKLVVAHGRLPPTQLEEIMTAFYEGRFDVLLSTSIVESGLDVPSANTLVIHRADMFGLAQLYQLRGRIGRSKLRGYAYLTYAADRPLSDAAQKRLEVIETLDTLGAGFSLASHDMDIRGAGNLLGEEQSGHVREVGIELYQQMLEEAVANARQMAEGIAPAEEGWTPQINLGMPVLIPDSYVADLDVRMELYRRLSQLADEAEIEGFAAELIDRFGPLPEEVETLLAIVTLKRLCRKAAVERFDAGPKGAVVTFHAASFKHPEKLVAYIGQQAGTVKLRPDQKLVYIRSWDEPATRLKGARRFLRDLAALVA